MAEDWDAIAVEVSDAIDEIGFSAALERQCEQSGPDGGDEYANVGYVTVIDFDIEKRDASGMVTTNVRTLMMKGNGITPAKGWRINVRDEWHRIAKVKPLAPGGVDLLFELELEG